MDKAEYRNRLSTGLAQGVSPAELVREVYLTYPTFSFVAKPTREYAIRNAISNHFNTNIYHVQFGGSGKTGESYHKQSDFVAGRSDLDAAIICHRLFLKYLEIACEVTDNFTDMATYGGREDHARTFRQYVSRGILIPAYMPNCPERTAWNAFFDNLSALHVDLFNDINCWIYSTQRIFELKFSRSVRILEEKK